MRDPTERELFILDLIDKGVPVSMIAKELGVHPSTVKQSVISLRMKLGAPGIRQLPFLARQSGWIQ